MSYLLTVVKIEDEQQFNILAGDEEELADLVTYISTDETLSLQNVTNLNSVAMTYDQFMQEVDGDDIDDDEPELNFGNEGNN